MGLSPTGRDKLAEARADFETVKKMEGKENVDELYKKYSEYFDIEKQFTKETNPAAQARLREKVQKAHDEFDELTFIVGFEATSAVMALVQLERQQKGQG